MKLIAGCILTLLFAVAFNFAFAQAPASAIHGVVQTDSATPADAATVVLIKSADSSVVRSTISGNDGSFNFTPIPAGSYLVFITKLNYTHLYAGPFEVLKNQNLDAGDITIKAGATQLNEVRITGKKDFVEVHPDKTVLNVEQNMVASGSSLYDVLVTAPGVKIVDDEILYRGGQKALIAINGKPVLLTGDELINLLKNYQSSNVSQIELIDNPGSRYDASAGGGMINIILKKNKNEGSSASVSQSAAVGQDYKLSTNLGFALRTEKLNLFASYGFQDSKSPHTIYNNRNVAIGSQLYNFNLDYEADIKSLDNNFNVGADYQISKRQTIGFLVNGFFNDITIGKKNNTVISTNGDRDSSINTFSDIKRNLDNLNYNLNYKAELDKAGNSVLSADANYSDYRRHSNEMLHNDFFDNNGQPENNSLYYMDSSPSHITIKAANIDFTQAIAKTTHFDAGIKASRVNSDNQIEFEQQISGAFMPVPDLTDRFIYKENIDAAYAGFESKFNKTSISVKLRDERTSTSIFSANPGKQTDSSYNDIFPNIQLSQQAGKNNLLTIFYKRNINRPNYQDMNPFVGYVDQFYYSTGNPFLKPSYINTWQVSDMFMSRYLAALSMVVTNDYFNTIFEQDNLTKVYTNIKANLGTRYQYILRFDIPVDIAPWWNVDADLSLLHEKYDYTLDAGRQVQTNSANIYLTQTFQITPKLSAQIYNAYESKVYYDISDYQPLYYVNAGLSYSFMQNRGSIKLAASDIFNTFYNQYYTDFSNLNIEAKDKLGSRFITATFIYRFGSALTRGRTNTSEEQKRLSGNGEN
ncbi:MAG TPA: outer membrane beta-barrel protein [Mucilaginibacter sp.]|nr:outer membrane beta-barrel protein [Mucilaginibacter sp.]